MSQLLQDKIDWIIPKIKGKRVLDLGCVRHNIDETKKKDWLHGLIAAQAREVIGIDYLPAEVQELRKLGYNVRCENVETMVLEEKFQVVVAGDLIEHLNNFGLFLNQVGKCMDDDGVFLLTTPNPINFLRFLQIFSSGTAGVNAEHTCWFTEPVLIQLADRFGLVKRETVYVDDSRQYYESSKWKPFVALNSLICKIRHPFAETLCMEFGKRKLESDVSR